jgi:hypothetical protein
MLVTLFSIKQSLMQASYLGGYHCSVSYTAMSINPSPELKSLLEDALHEFENRAGTNLIQHQIIDRLKDCESPDSVIEVLREQAQAFRNFRGDDDKLMIWLKRTVDVLHTLSTSGVLGEGIGLVCKYSFHLTRMHHRNTLSLQPFPPAKAIFAGIGILLGVCVLIGFTQASPCDICYFRQAIKDVGKSYDAVVELFESFESFLRRLDIYTKIPSTTAMKGIIIKILIELLSTISLAIQQAKQGRLSKRRPLRPHP